MKKVLIIILVCLFNVGISCDGKFDKHIKELGKLNNLIKKGNWVEEQCAIIPKEEYYLLYKVTNDTIYNLEFIVTLPDEEYKLLEFQMKYSDSLYNYNLLMDIDTLYYYKESKYSGAKVFTAGKYYYLIKSPEERSKLTMSQKQYLLKNMDSLRLIKGDFVPEFPGNN